MTNDYAPLLHQLDNSAASKGANFTQQTAEQSAIALRALLEKAKKADTLIYAAMEWWADHENGPVNMTDAEFMKALWTYSGDNTTPCDECDGECGEPCAPCTVAQAHASLDAFIERWHKKHARAALGETK